MNEDTRIAVVCYEGDKRQVEQSLGFYLHHECPVVILSPEDSRAEISHPGVENRFAGKRAQRGPDAHARHLAHLKLLLTFPENHFLIHESDSVCLDPKIPAYLYDEPDVVWANTGEADPSHHPGFIEGCPKMSFQAPWFFSRKTIEAFIAASDSVVYSPDLPWVDLYLVQLTHAAGLPWRGFKDCYLGPISGRFDDMTGTFLDPGGEWEEAGTIFAGKPMTPKLMKVYEAGLKVALQYVNSGANMIHSVKNPIAARELGDAYQHYLGRQRAAEKATP